MTRVLILRLKPMYIPPQTVRRRAPGRRSRPARVPEGFDPARSTVPPLPPVRTSAWARARASTVGAPGRPGRTPPLLLAPGKGQAGTGSRRRKGKLRPERETAAKEGNHGQKRKPWPKKETIARKGNNSQKAKRKSAVRKGNHGQKRKLWPKKEIMAKKGISCQKRRPWPEKETIARKGNHSQKRKP